MKKREAMRLVKALRSGKYEQGVGYLNYQNKLCCLGVACEISKGIVRVSLPCGPSDTPTGVVYEGSAKFLPRSVMKRFGFSKMNGGREDGLELVIAGEAYSSLANANDCRVPFSVIADYIEANYLYL